MKKKVTIFLIAFFAITKLQAQDSDSEKSKYQFAKQVFRKEYKKKNSIGFRELSPSSMNILGGLMKRCLQLEILARNIN
jgi:hypothetical protein